MVNFDARNDSATSEKIDEVLAVVGELTSSFVEENDAVDVIFEIWGGEENVAIVATIFVSIRDI